MFKSIKTRILAAFMVTLLLFIGIGTYQLIILNNQLQTIKLMKNNTLQTALKADGLKVSVVLIKEQLADVSATRAEEGMDDGLQGSSEQVNLAKQSINDLIKLNPKEQKSLQDLSSKLNNYYALGQKMVQAYINGGVSQGNLVMPEFDKATDDINGNVDVFRKEALTNIDNTVAGLEKMVQQTLAIVIILFILIIIAVIICSIMLAHQVTRPIDLVISRVKEITEGDGDLTQRIEIKSFDEINLLVKYVNLFIENLATIIKKIKTSSIVLNNTSEEISYKTKALASIAQEQEGIVVGVTTAVEHMDIGVQDITSNMSSLANNVSSVSSAVSQMGSSVQDTARNVEATAATINNISTSIEQMTDSIKNISMHSKEVQKDAQTTVSKANEGNIAVNNTIEQMDKMYYSVIKLSESIKELGNSAEKIDEIINVISNISDQTNLLSLNAAIEAARAGDAGKGFAVVADAIRQLSEKSREATKDIEKLIIGIQNQVKDAINETNDSTANVNKASEFVKSTGSAFQDIFKAINETSSLIQDIAASIEQQEENGNKITNAIENMEDIVGQLSATTQEQAAGSDEIVKSVLQINDLMQQVSATTEKQAAGSQEVVKLVEGINKGAAEVANGSEGIIANTANLSSQVRELIELVYKFKV